MKRKRFSEAHTVKLPKRLGRESLQGMSVEKLEFTDK